MKLVSRPNLLRLTSLTAMTLLAGSALADLPPAMDRAPRGAAVTIVIRDVGGLKGKVEGLAAKFGAPTDGPMEQLEQFLGTEGFNTKGSMAIVFLDDGHGNLDGDEPVGIISVTDFSKFVVALGGDAGAKSSKLPKIDDIAFTKDIGGGFAVIGPEAAVKAFEAPAGQIAGIKQKMGPACNRIADVADVFVLADLSKFEETLLTGLDEMRGMMDQGAAMMPGGADMAKMFDAMHSTVRQGLTDVHMGVLGLTMNESGVSFDIATQFDDGSKAGGWFQHEGKASETFAKIPAMPFLVAGAMDLANPTVQGAMKFFADMQKQMNAGMDMGGGAWMKLADKVQAQAFIMGTSPALMQAGIFSNTLTFTRTSDPAGVVAATKESLTKMSGQEQNGIKFITKYVDAGTEVAGQKADSWSMKFEVDPNSDQAMQIQQAMMMFMGQSEEMSGLTLATKDGVISTLSNNTKLLARAIDAASGKGSMGDDPQTSQTIGALPKGRTFEVYLGVKGIIETVGGFMQQFGMPVPKVGKSDMPPIGVAGTTDGGGLSIRLHAPMKTLDGIAQVIKDMQAGEDAPPEEKPEGERKKPKF